MLSSPGAVGRVGRVGAGSKPGAPPVVGNPPVNTALPAITGTPTVGQTLTVSNGTWTNSPTGYARKWTRDGAAIGGATGATYALVADDAGKMIGCTVTATNADGSNSAPATAVGPVAAAPARTYAEFQTHVQGLAAGAAAWAGANVPTGKRYTQAAATFTGSMVGSSWGPSAPEGFASAASYLGRALQHAFPSQAAIDQAMANTATIYFEAAVSPAANSVAFPAVTRNGFTSSASSSTGITVRQLVDLIRWDFTLGKAFRSNPSAGTAETEYTF